MYRIALPVTERVYTQVVSMVRRGRSNGQKRTECVNGHPFDEANTYQDVKRSRRQCRKCNSLAGRRERASHAYTSN